MKAQAEEHRANIKHLDQALAKKQWGKLHRAKVKKLDEATA
ncbi:hypothetical protein LCAA2362_2939 [Lacticaseibacillus casei A2-362]|nr:hypothetical protein LCAA2362_2939 [Lacticaseibacillus casei A2-362]